MEPATVERGWQATCHCGAAVFARHPVLGALCWWHMRLVELFRGKDD